MMLLIIVQKTRLCLVKYGNYCQQIIQGLNV